MCTWTYPWGSPCVKKLVLGSAGWWPSPPLQCVSVALPVGHRMASPLVTSLLCFLHPALPSPILPQPTPAPGGQFEPTDQPCLLYPELGNVGTLQFLEDCPSIHR